MILKPSHLISLFLQLFFLAIGNALIYGQHINSDFKVVPVEHSLKLKHPNVNAIHQDSLGFMWFAGEYGLQRFDGIQFKSYSPRTTDRQKKIVGPIEQIIPDKNGNFWLLYTAKGIGHFNYAREQFEHYDYHPKKVGGLLTNQTTKVVVTESESVYVCSDNGLQLFRGPENGFETILGGFGSDRLAVLDVFEDKRGTVWIATENGLYQRSKKLQKLQQVRFFVVNGKKRELGKINTLVTDSKGTLWAGGENGLFKLDTLTDTLVFVPLINGKTVPRTPSISTIKVHPFKEELWITTTEAVLRVEKPLDARRTQTHSFFENHNFQLKNVSKNFSPVSFDHHGNPWFYPGINVPGIFRFDYEGQRIDSLLHNSNSSLSISNASDVIAAYTDNDDVLWVSTVDKGLLKVNLQRKRFRTFTNKPSDPHSITSKDVYGVYRLKDGRILAGGQSGLDLYDPLTQKWENFNAAPENSSGMPSQFAGTIRCFDPNEQVFWVGFWEGLLSKFDIRTKRFTNYTFDPQNPKSARCWSVREIYQDKDDPNILWIGSSSEGLTKLDLRTDEFRYFMPKPREGKEALQYNWILSIHDDEDGYLWLGTREAGLVLFSKKEQRFIDNFPGIAAHEVLHNSEINSIVKSDSDQDVLWLGTGRDGLLEYHKKNGTITTYNDQNGLPSSNLQYILKEEHGNLWISTIAGVSNFNVKERSATNYHYSDGLGNYDFNEKSGHLSDDGHLLFGGPNGISMFHPDSIGQNYHRPRLALTSFLVDNHELSVTSGDGMQTTLGLTRKVTLDYAQNNIAISFASMHYAQPEKTRFRYRLKGYDTNWKFTDYPNNTARYTGIPPGNYTFLLEQKNGALWEGNGNALEVIVKPPFYGTLWFWGGVFILAVSGVFLYHGKPKPSRKPMYAELTGAETIFGQFGQTDKEESLTKITDGLRPAELAFIAKCKSLILKNSSDKGFNHETLGTALGMSKSKLYRKLKSLTNYSPGEFILRVRMEKSVEDLRSGKSNISQTAYGLGYSSPSNFSRDFKKIFGKSPRAFAQT